jgi:MOSC domain-containing protein YiiM
MTTLAQGDLPADTDILRTLVRQNGGKAGVYAEVVEGGRIRRGDTVQLL